MKKSYSLLLSLRNLMFFNRHKSPIADDRPDETDKSYNLREEII